MSGGNFTNIFGGTQVRPAQVSYQAITLSVSTYLAWPTESFESATYVASEVDVTATSGGLTLYMPSALLGATGPVGLFVNVGSTSFTLADNTGNAITTIAAGIAYDVTLTSNLTQAGTWRVIQRGATTSSATASSLADNQTIQATGTVLQTEEKTSLKSANYTIVSTDRGSTVALQSGSASSTFQLDTIANLTVGYWVDVANQTAANTLTITTSSSQTINGGASIVLAAGASAKIVCASGGFSALLGAGSGGGSSSANLPNWLYKNTTYTANSGDSVLADTTSAAWTLSLPASPSLGNWVKVGDGGGVFATNNLTINPNGATIMGASGNQSVSTNNFSFTLVYNGTTWKYVT